MTEYFRRKRRQLRAHLSKQQRDIWEALEKEKGRALSKEEIKNLFGWINGKGQHVRNTS
jgi:hypothetical protein